MRCYRSDLDPAFKDRGINSPSGTSLSAGSGGGS